MKRFLTPALAAAVLFSACDAGQALRVEVTDRVISSDYVGNGVEWDPYDEAEAWGAEVSDADWAKLSERLDFMRPGYVRCMINSPYRYYDAATVGIDFTARDLQRKFRAEGKPWELCKGFDSSAAIGDWVPVEKLNDIQKVNFHLNIDGKTVQQGNTADMLFSVDQIIAYVSRFCTLKIGDLLFTGTPVGVGPVQIGNHLEGFLENEKLLDFYIR